MDRCDNCGKETGEGELQEVINYESDEIQHVCSHCLGFYTKCDRCGMYRPNDLVTFESGSNVHFCNFCHEKEGDLVPPQGIDMEDESWQD